MTGVQTCALPIFIGANTQALPTKEIGYTPLSVNKEQLAADVATKQKAFEDFAKQRNYLQNFGFSGQRSGVSDLERAAGDYGYWSSGNRVSANLADYLSQGGNAFQTADVYDGYKGQGSYYEALERSKQDLINQINQDLQAYGYNNLIKGV